MAGYSTRSLVEKLGLKREGRNIILNSPYPLEKIFTTPLSDFNFQKTLSGKFNFLQLFTKSRSELEKEFPRLKSSLETAGSLWVSWPKGGSKIPTDLTENIIREIGLENGLVDVKVIAVDEDWSGLKFVYRLEDRNK